MSDSCNTITKDPSLKRYFKYMLTNRRMSVQFTSRKIREIIEVDLGIKLENTQSLYSRVCIEAFAYYMQSWPEWNVAIKSQYSDTLYECLITFLRNKLLYLKQREQNICEKNIVHFPKQSKENENKKMVPLYTLKVNVPEHLWNTCRLNFRNNESNEIYLEFLKCFRSFYVFESDDLFNHPYVFAQFDLPNVISFCRSTPFKIERSLNNVSNGFPTIDENHIISILHDKIQTEPTVYSYELMFALLTTLKKIISKYTTEIHEQEAEPIYSFCNAFLLDIKETNLLNDTICVGATVQYNLGKAVYVADSDITPTNRSEKIVYRKIITPIVSYTLLNCCVKKDDVNADGTFSLLNFTNEEEVLFIRNIKKSLKFKCLLCDAFWHFSELKNHFIQTHCIDTVMICARCSQEVHILELLKKRWKHC